jgi:hypothetical protein
MELDTGERPLLDRHHTRPSWSTVAVASAGSAGSTAKLWAKYTSAPSTFEGADVLVASSVFQPMCARRPRPSHGPGRRARPSTLLALAERSWSPAQMPATGGRRRRAREAASEPLEARRRALDVADAGDHRERRVGHDGRIDGDDRLGTRADERGRERAEVPRAVVGERDPVPAAHARPFVDRMPASPDATACRNDCPSALYAASAT